MNPSLHDPRPYMLSEDDTHLLSLGEFDSDGIVAGASFIEKEILQKLNREQRVEYKQARKEGFHPLLLVDLETGVTFLEMRKQELPFYITHPTKRNA